MAAAVAPGVQYLCARIEEVVHLAEVELFVDVERLAPWADQDLQGDLVVFIARTSFTAAYELADDVLAKVAAWRLALLAAHEHTSAR
jgi:hypothetical protein